MNLGKIVRFAFWMVAFIIALLFQPMLVLGIFFVFYILYYKGEEG